MLQLINKSPFQAAFCVLPDESAVDTLYTVVKATFELQGPELALADPQLPIHLADVYWAEPGQSSLRYAGEMHLPKPSTDVVLVGQAWAPSGKKVDRLDVTLSIADAKKTVCVFGDREWQGGLLKNPISAPKPFRSIPLVYERAYGGVHVIDEETGETVAEERNPVGVGFRGKRKAKEFVGQALPNIEDPGKLIQSPGDPVDPAGFGFVAPSWLPRRSFAGTYDEAWVKKRAPYFPPDFDSRFFSAAHPDLVFDRFLEGGEPVQIAGVHPDGPIRFRVPVCRMNTRVRIAGRVEEPVLQLETVLIEPDENRLCLTWRAALPCDKKALRVESIEIEVDQLEPRGRVD